MCRCNEILMIFCVEDLKVIYIFKEYVIIKWFK